MLVWKDKVKIFYQNTFLFLYTSFTMLILYYVFLKVFTVLTCIYCTYVSFLFKDFYYRWYFYVEGLL